MLDEKIADLLGPASQTGAALEPQILPLMRKGMVQAGRALPAPAVEVRDYRVGEIPLRLYLPRDAPAGKLPLLVFLHGGGWILGDLDSHDAPCRLLSHRTPCAVLAVGYRLAPEHRFPASLHDCADAVRWAFANAEELGCDTRRIAIGGESAGANLAAAVAILLRDDRPHRPAFQFLVHPATDLTLTQPSIDEVILPGMTRPFLETCVAMYANGHDPTDPLLSPLHCADLSDLPPAVIYTVEVDPLRDDGEAYALALARAGNEVFVQRLIGLPHGFMFLPASIGAVDRAFDLLAERLATYFRTP